MITKEAEQILRELETTDYISEDDLSARYDNSDFYITGLHKRGYIVELRSTDYKYLGIAISQEGKNYLYTIVQEEIKTKRERMFSIKIAFLGAALSIIASIITSCIVSKL